MFKKIIIAEDHEVRNLGVVNALIDMQIQKFDFVSYCDEALQKIKTAAAEKDPYDLLITDLCFEEDHTMQKITRGQDLITEARKIQPNLKVIAFSVENKAKIIDDLFKVNEINGFVSKGRNDGKVLKSTMKKILNGEIVIPQEILNSIRNIRFDLTENDILLMELLAKGLSQSEIEGYLKQNKINPNSKSYIEKRLNDLRENFNAKNNIELVVICKDNGLI